MATATVGPTIWAHLGALTAGRTRRLECFVPTRGKFPVLDPIPREDFAPRIVQLQRPGERGLNALVDQLQDTEGDLVHPCRQGHEAVGCPRYKDGGISMPGPGCVTGDSSTGVNWVSVASMTAAGRPTTTLPNRTVTKF
mgnify:CR=1 FL=1